jgi:hypothetical protein
MLFKPHHPIPQIMNNSLQLTITSLATSCDIAKITSI